MDGQFQPVLDPVVNPAVEDPIAHPAPSEQQSAANPLDNQLNDSQVALPSSEPQLTLNPVQGEAAGDENTMLEHQSVSDQWHFDYDYLSSGANDNRPPILVASAGSEFNSVNHRNNNFLKGVKWAPDGSCLVNDNLQF